MKVWSEDNEIVADMTCPWSGHVTSVTSPDRGR